MGNYTWTNVTATSSGTTWTGPYIVTSGGGGGSSGAGGGGGGYYYGSGGSGGHTSPAPRPQTALEWLDAEIEAVCRLARLAA